MARRLRRRRVAAVAAPLRAVSPSAGCVGSRGPAAGSRWCASRSVLGCRRVAAVPHRAARRRRSPVALARTGLRPGSRWCAPHQCSAADASPLSPRRASLRRRLPAALARAGQPWAPGGARRARARRPPRRRGRRAAPRCVAARRPRSLVRACRSGRCNARRAHGGAACRRSLAAFNYAYGVSTHRVAHSRAMGDAPRGAASLRESPASAASDYYLIDRGTLAAETIS